MTPSLLFAAQSALDLLRNPDASAFEADRVEQALSAAIDAHYATMRLPTGITLGPDGLPVIRPNTGGKPA